jgi:hypothetical protein
MGEPVCHLPSQPHRRQDIPQAPPRASLSDAAPASLNGLDGPGSAATLSCMAAVCLFGSAFRATMPCVLGFDERAPGADSPAPSCPPSRVPTAALLLPAQLPSRPSAALAPAGASTIHTLRVPLAPSPRSRPSQTASLCLSPPHRRCHRFPCPAPPPSPMYSTWHLQPTPTPSSGAASRPQSLSVPNRAARLVAWPPD